MKIKINYITLIIVGLFNILNGLIIMKSEVTIGMGVGFLLSLIIVLFGDWLEEKEMMK